MTGALEDSLSFKTTWSLRWLDRYDLSSPEGVESFLHEMIGEFCDTRNFVNVAKK